MGRKNSARGTSFRRLGIGEQLEGREMLSGHGLSQAFFIGSHLASAAGPTVTSSAHVAAATASVSHLTSSTSSSSSTSTAATVLATQLTDSAGTATGSASYESYTYNGTTETRFQVRVTGATASTTLDVSVDGVIVGQIATDANGAGKLTLSSSPHGSHEQQLPANFPTSVTSGSTVSVGTLSGSLATPTNTGGGCGEHTGTTLAAQLTDSEGSAVGTATYFTGTSPDGTTVTKFKVSVTGATADTTLDVAIAGTVVGQVTTDANGAGSLVLSSNPTSSEQSLPSNFPTSITSGTAVTVGTLSGTLATPASTGHGFGFHGFGRRR